MHACVWGEGAAGGRGGGVHSKHDACLFVRGCCFVVVVGLFVVVVVVFLC